MPDKAKVNVRGDEVTVDDSLLGKLMAGTKGHIKIKTPFGVREIHKVKDLKGKVLKDDLHPEKVGKKEK